ncbi:cohesin domain-containing protein [Pseudoduganella armeniaca]|uniref:PEP-CTERM sorting domain-containing protein n=1 Tax=Pseudoduganella armeniaca TaxID=2072590 RepID=A0A2R4C901_9BURK|nr:cohesin domain-containing protein [Pseudoduganella armeniaca]AVR96093.1 PEP-CTERM sorting domain-containing protein [Pseudoduganella armeniaca]
MKSWQAWNNRLLIALLLGAASAQASAAPVLSVSATPNPAVRGSTVDLSVLIADVSDLYGYQFSLSFDPSVLRATGVTEGAFLGTGGSTVSGDGGIDNAAGTVSFIYNTLVGPTAGVSGSGTLAHIRFDVIGVGTTPLTFADALFLDSRFDAIDVRIESTPLQAVPEPEAYLMLGVGLVGLAALRRRRAG